MNNKKTIYAVCLLLLVTVMTIGYALISGTLNINGNAKITAASWEIYFKNVEIKDGSVTPDEDTKITDKTSLSYNIKLKKPGDYFEFNVDVVNNGMLDAMIDKITILPDISDKPYLKYTVKYLDDSNVEEKDILNSKKARTIKVRVEYLKTIENNELNSSEQNLNMSFEMKYVQADATAKVPTAADKNTSVWEIISGDGTHAGDELALGDEHFYVVSNDGTNITMFAKYNLLVGNASGHASSTATPLTNPTGIQDESAIGQHYKPGTSSWEYPSIGTVSFSSSRYWYDGSSLKSEYGTSYPAYVYGDNASIKVYVDNYRDYLESLGAEIEEARLISKEELAELGCPSGNNSGYCSTNGAPSWVYQTSYWTGSAGYHDCIWNLDSNGAMSCRAYNNDYDNGARPVIVISTDAI